MLSELASTEQDYVDKLQYCLDHYNTTTHEEGGLAPPTSQALSTLFGNLGDILAFHKEYVLHSNKLSCVCGLCWYVFD